VAEAIIQTLQSARQNVLIQKFVKESRGRDIRALVVGDRVVAAMRRIALDGEFRSNVHRGARAEGVDVDPAAARMAVRAAQIVGLRVAGVDMVEGEAGPQIIEVNSSPGLEGIESATGVDVAGEIVGHLEKQVLFPEVDIRERLTLASGYGVAEFAVLPESELAGKTLAETALRDREVRVLSIARGTLTIPNPRGDCRIMPGDVLLCFGDHLALRGLIPPTGRKRRGSVAPPSGG
jgi:ribosomal protein S6--L-glutamate ligase